MKIPTTVLLSAILAITSLTAMAIPTFNVNVTNFPLDEEGNLKVADRAFEEPPPLSGEPSNLQEVIVDLENLGCVFVHLTEWGFSVADFSVENYTEFRRIAYNSKVVWVHAQPPSYTILFTIFNAHMLNIISSKMKQTLEHQPFFLCS